MSPAERRTRAATPADAKVLVARATALLTAAELLLEDREDPAAQSASAAVSVIAGIAASDALCALALGERSRGQDHRAAVGLLAAVVGTDSPLLPMLSRLLDVKDQAHYGTRFIRHEDAMRALRQATALTDAAHEAARR